MGHLYSANGLLCCDFCLRDRTQGNNHLESDVPKEGYRAVRDIWNGAILRYAKYRKFVVRRLKCPYNWCRGPAICSDCRAAGKAKVCHASCKKNAAEYDAERKLEVAVPA